MGGAHVRGFRKNESSSADSVRADAAGGGTVTGLRGERAACVGRPALRDGEKLGTHVVAEGLDERDIDLHRRRLEGPLRGLWRLGSRSPSNAVHKVLKRVDSVLVVGFERDMAEPVIKGREVLADLHG